MEASMESLEQENSSSIDQKMVTQELIKGQESAHKLKILLQETLLPVEGHGKNPEIEFLEEILGSLSRALTALRSGGAPETPLDQAGTPCSEQGSTDSSKKRKIQSARRNGYRRRAHPYSSTKVLSQTMEDGYTWRKYGQKDIFSSKHPRSYFRCTHKYDQECQATRQVQKSEDDPSQYVITYMGEHTCRDPSKPPHLLPPSHQRPPYIITFGSETARDNQQEPPLNSPHSTVLKQESDEEELDPTPGRSCSEFFMFPDIDAFERSAPMAHYMGTELDRCDVMSDVHSSNSCLDMEFNTIPFDLDEISDVFSLDHDVLFQN